MSDLTFIAGDTGPAVFGTLAIGGTAVDLTTADEVRFQMRRVGEFRFAVDAVATILVPAAGTVMYSWSAGDLAVAGDYVSRWEITFNDTSVQHTEPENTITVEAA